MNNYKENYRAEALKNMDKVMRLINDEGNGVYETWLMGGVPDGSTEQDFIEYAKDKEMYDDCCRLFAELISDLIANGDWDSEGWSMELFNTEAYRKGRQ